MTLVLALHSTEGIVLASDSQMTFTTSGQHVRADTHKIQCPWKNVAWGASGNVGVIQRIEQGLQRKYPRQDAFDRKTVAELRSLLSQDVAKIVRPLATDQYLNMPERPWQTDVLFAGYAQGDPFIVSVEANLVETDHMPTGFCAIGSGDVFAYAGLSHFEVKGRSLYEAKLIAHRVLSDAIKVAAYGLGEPVEMIEIALEADGHHCSTRKLERADVALIADKVEEWKLGEAGFLTDFVGAPAPLVADTTNEAADAASQDAAIDDG
jgi:20S proteasome alpha/beta subunit